MWSCYMSRHHSIYVVTIANAHTHLLQHCLSSSSVFSLTSLLSWLTLSSSICQLSVPSFTARKLICLFGERFIVCSSLTPLRRLILSWWYCLCILILLTVYILIFFTFKSLTSRDGRLPFTVTLKRLISRGVMPPWLCREVTPPWLAEVFWSS